MKAEKKAKAPKPKKDKTPLDKKAILKLVKYTSIIAACIIIGYTIYSIAIQ